MYSYSFPIYNPSYTLDFETMILSPVPNYFPDLLAKQAELAKTGESQLTQQEIDDLSEKYETKQMSNKDLLRYLSDKGVIDRPKIFDLENLDGGERVVYTGPQAWFEPVKSMSSQSIGTPGVNRFVSTFMEEMHKLLLAEQATAELRQSTGHIA